MNRRKTNIYHSFEALSHDLGAQRTVATIGFFDGVHRGHQDLLRHLQEEAHKRGALSLVLSFSNHPLSIVGKEGQKAPQLLCNLKQKLRYLEATGVDIILLLPFTSELAQKDGASFAALLHERCHTDALVMGYDNHFGSKRFKTREETEAYLATWCIPTLRQNAVRIDHILVSSSVIRAAIGAGDFQIAHKLLGRPFAMQGYVDHGDKIGRTIDYPTANIRINKELLLLPSHGIFVSEVLYGGKKYGAMSYYGKRPTLTLLHDEIRLEAYLFDFSGELYGQEVELLFYYYLRNDIKFNSLDELRTQLVQDEKAARAYLQTMNKDA